MSRLDYLMKIIERAKHRRDIQNRVQALVSELSVSDRLAVLMDVIVSDKDLSTSMPNLSVAFPNETEAEVKPSKAERTLAILKRPNGARVEDISTEIYNDLPDARKKASSMLSLLKGQGRAIRGADDRWLFVTDDIQPPEYFDPKP